MLGRGLQCPDDSQRLLTVDSVGRNDIDELHLPRCHGAGLVEHDRVHLPRRLQHLRALDQNPELRAATGADEKGCRRREAERARAGDDQDRDGGCERERRAAAAPQPEGQRRDGEGDHHRHEDAGDAVGEALHRRLPRLGGRDEACDLGERGVGADADRADDEPAAGVDRGPEDLVAGLHLDRHALAGEERLVDR
jgi:hypothetical protein